MKACTRLMVEGKGPVVRSRKTWQNTVPADMRVIQVDSWDVHDRNKWRAKGCHKANQAASGTPHSNEDEERRTSICIIYYLKK